MHSLFVCLIPSVSAHSNRGVFLRDLLYLEEANKDKNAEGHVDLQKFCAIGDTILMLTSFQLSAYPEKENNAARTVILNQTTLDPEVRVFF